MTHPIVDGPLPRATGDLALLGLQSGIALQHDRVRLKEAGKEPGRVDAEVDVGHCRQERVRGGLEEKRVPRVARLLTQIVAIVLDIPLGVLVAQVWIAGDLLLLEPPLGQLLPAGGKGAVLQVVDELQPRGDCVHSVIDTPTHNQHAPYIVGIACTLLEMAAS